MRNPEREIIPKIKMDNLYARTSQNTPNIRKVVVHKIGHITEAVRSKSPYMLKYVVCSSFGVICAYTTLPIVKTNPYATPDMAIATNAIDCTDGMTARTQKQIE
jgi:hypothetical protein